MQLKKFSPAAQKILVDARSLAKANQSAAVEPEHLAIALIESNELTELVKKKKTDIKALRASLFELLKKIPQTLDGDIPLSPRLIQALSAAHALSLSKGHESVYVADMFLSLLRSWKKFGALGSVLAHYFLDELGETALKSPPQVKESSLIAQYTRNLSLWHKEGKLEPVYERREECERLIELLSRKTRNNPILIGDPGVGRYSIVLAFIKRIAENDVPSHLVSKEVLSLDVGALVAGTTLRGQFEERVSTFLGELRKEEGRYLLLVQDLAQLMGTGGGGVSDAVSLFKPFLERGEIQIIGLATEEMYKKRIETDASFERLFQPMWVGPPTRDECLKIMQGVREQFERYHGVFIEDDALDAAIELSEKHIQGRVLPQVAIDVLDEALAKHRIAMDRKPKSIKLASDALAKEQLAFETLDGPEKKGPQGEKIKGLIAKYDHRLKDLTHNFEEQLLLIESIRAVKDAYLAKLKESEQEKSVGNMKQAARLRKTNLSDLARDLKQMQKKFSSITPSKRLIDPFVTRDDIAQIISFITGIPRARMLQSERERLLSMETMLEAQVIGQERGIKAICNAIRRARVGLKDQKKPIGSFLFLGPTGVGKTELALKLTSFLFDDERAMIRFDMSEFMERHTVARLIGAPVGYHGADEGGQLTEAVRRRPYCVILFDEIEKAHHDVLNVLLQVLDDGRLSDSKGHLVSFQHAVVIMTSNLGAEILLTEDARTNPKKAQEMVMDRVLQFLRPELVNRIDEVIQFNPLGQTEIRKIVDVLLLALSERLQGQGCSLVVDDEAKDKLVEQGYNPAFGARPLKRVIQRVVENPIATMLLESKVKPGSTFKVHVEHGAIALTNN